MDFHNTCANLMKTMYTSNERLIIQICDELGQADKADSMIEKYLCKDFIKIKQMRDPSKPKKPKTSYMFYCAEMRASVTKKNPTAKMGEMSKILGMMWNKLKPEDKTKYEKMADDEKETYNESIRDWKLNTT